MGQILLKNEGNGAALNVKWRIDGALKLLPVFPIKDSDVLCEGAYLIHDKRIEVSYESLSGTRYKSSALWITTPEEAAHLSNEVVVVK